MKKRISRVISSQHCGRLQLFLSRKRRSILLAACGWFSISQWRMEGKKGAFRFSRRTNGEAGRGHRAQTDQYVARKDPRSASAVLPQRGAVDVMWTPLFRITWVRNNSQDWRQSRLLDPPWKVESVDSALGSLKHGCNRFHLQPQCSTHWPCATS